MPIVSDRLEAGDEVKRPILGREVPQIADHEVREVASALTSLVDRVRADVHAECVPGACTGEEGRPVTNAARDVENVATPS